MPRWVWYAVGIAAVLLIVILFHEHVHVGVH